LKTVKLKEIAADKSVNYIPGGEAWRALVPPDMPPNEPDSNSYRSGSFSPDKPNPGRKGKNPDSFYPRKSVAKPSPGSDSRDLPSAELKPVVIGKGVQTADKIDQEPSNFCKKSQSGSQSRVKEGSSQASADWDLVELMERFNKLK
jgi:hypothetical protein